ncbi:hypothetical protein LIER_00982 [Lithospermum erythrorhizon]|uniref:Uncharacterized protein n=1 Tax=Lithospermum erythrorhizon TaxID=34254 RepID=A0AAV3NNV4_LITER
MGNKEEVVGIFNGFQAKGKIIVGLLENGSSLEGREGGRESLRENGKEDGRDGVSLSKTTFRIEGLGGLSINKNRELDGRDTFFDKGNPVMVKFKLSENN